MRYKITSFIPHIKMFGENDINMGSPQRKIASHPASAPGATPLRGVGHARDGHRADLQQIGRDAKNFASASGWYRAPDGHTARQPLRQCDDTAERRAPGTVTPPARLIFVNIFKIVLVRLK